MATRPSHVVSQPCFLRPSSPSWNPLSFGISKRKMAHTCWKCGATALADPALATPKTAIDFTHLFAGNDVPGDSQIPSIRDIILAGQGRVDALDVQIRALQATLTELVRQRKETAEHVNQHRATLSPVRRIPPELVCAIFSFTLPSDGGEVAENPPWYLGHICRSWRFSALAYPQLWSYLVLPSSPPQDHRVSMWQTLLLRSANAPLTVSCTATVTPQVADIAIAQCSRWTCLRLNMMHSNNGLDWLSPIKDRLSSLEKLELLHAPGVALSDLFSASPRLQKFMATDWDFSYYSPEVAVPWNQITHYRGAYRVATQLDILRVAPNLLECAISFESVDHGSFSRDPASIILPHLRRLCIERPRFLTHLISPAVEELHCIYSEDGDMFILPFLHRSGCPLQKLVLMSCDISTELLTLLKGVTGLRYLLISVHNPTEQGLPAPDETAEQTLLFERMMTPDLLPNLTSFVYGLGEGFPHDSFFTMARSRFERKPGLSYLRVFDPHDRVDPDDFAPAMESLRDEGFDAAFLLARQYEPLTPEGFFS